MRILLSTFLVMVSLGASASDFVGSWQIKETDSGGDSLCPGSGVFRFNKREDAKENSLSYSLYLGGDFSFWMRNYYWSTSPGSFGEGTIHETESSIRYSSYTNQSGHFYQERVAIWSKGAKTYISTYKLSEVGTDKRSRSCKFLVEKI